MSLVAAAMQYKGVRFRHRGRSANRLDCAGLVWRAYHDCGVTLPDFRLYGPEPHNDGLTQHMIAALGEPLYVSPVREKDLLPGDVIALRYAEEPHHVGLVTDYPYGGALGMIHADGHNRQVIWHRLSGDMIARITHVYRRPV